MPLIYFFVSYLLMLLASSILITSFFCVTRGFKEVMPDGTERRYGKILKGYYFFWFREKAPHHIQYSGDELANLAAKIKEHYSGPLSLVGNVFDPPSLTRFEVSPSFTEAVPLLRHKLEVSFRVEEEDSTRLIVSAFSRDPHYVFPDWLRTVMAGCITCTPTVYGNIIYWSFILCFRDSVLYESLFGCFRDPHAGIILVWLAYWISLAWLNTVLWNIYDK